jgi:bifunctional ADP-heptose synthase (sugar kinase/adenylyltransferase)
MPKNILVIGDLIIDETFYVDVNRISPEAPIPTAELLSKDPIRTPGGAGFAATFAANQGNNVSIFTSVTEENKNTLFKNNNIRIFNSLTAELNVTKTRFIDKKSQYHILRLDNDKIVPSPNITPEDIIKSISGIIKGNQIDACLLADYKKGLFNPTYQWHKLIDYLIGYNIPTILDTKMMNIKHFMLTDQLNPNLWLKLNKSEAEKVSYTLYGEYDKWSDHGDSINQLIITKGPEGAEIYINGKLNIKVEPPKNSPAGAPDTTGCGDIFDVSFIKRISEGATLENALNYAVKIASKFAWIPFKEKLCSPQMKD